LTTRSPAEPARRDADRIAALTRAPALQLVEVPVSLLDTVRSQWTPRRLVAAGLVAPVLVVVLWWSAAPTVPLALLVTVGLGAAVALASYLPAPGQSVRQAFGGTCGVAGMCLPLAGSGRWSPGPADPVCGPRSGWWSWAWRSGR
jgi:hypothetical protein